TDLVDEVEADVVLNGIDGSIGLGPTLAALRTDARLALANKESLVAGGELVIGAASPGQLVPVDSEHSAMAQCLRAGTPDEVERLVLTASGGPFRGRTRDELLGVRADQALAVGGPLGGDLRRRLDRRQGVAAVDEAADRAGPGLARPAPRGVEAAGLDPLPFVDVRTRRRGDLPGYPGGPGGGRRRGAAD